MVRWSLVAGRWWQQSEVSECTTLKIVGTLRAEKDSNEQSRYRVVSAGPVGNGTWLRRRVVMASWLMYWKLGIMLHPMILTMTRDDSLDTGVVRKAAQY